jgi:uncharacterized protein YecA (UPF0149 family)
MSLFELWEEKATKHETKKDFKKFWKEYSATEKKIYEDILQNHTQVFEGTIKDLSEKYETSKELFVGFLDGINNSLQETLKLKELKEDSFIQLKINFEKLYYNMLEAKADYLFNLPQWDKILDVEKRKEIKKEQRKSKTLIKEHKIGRNDLCPCGSGKKYKKCCGQ